MLSLFGARGELHDLTKARQTSALTRALRHHGNNPNSLDVAGKTALHVAVDQGYSAEAGLLLQHGANVNVADKVRSTSCGVTEHHDYSAERSNTAAFGCDATRHSHGATTAAAWCRRGNT